MEAEKINIRYTPKRKRNFQLVEHYQAKKMKLEKVGGTINEQELIEAIGITMERWKKLLAGGEPTLGEAAAYSNYFRINITKLILSC